MTSNSNESLSGEVLVFDSGVGGLSICKALARHLPAARLCFASDNAAFPYGSKSREQIQRRLEATLIPWCAQRAPTLIVVGCNTASTLCLPFLRARLTAPVVGVVPAIKPAAKLSQTGVIALLATPQTVTSQYTRELIARHANGCEVVKIHSKKLVALAERKLRSLPVPRHEVSAALEPLLKHAARLDTIVLGCTHFPLLLSELRRAARITLPRVNHWVDSGEAIARRVGSLLPGHNEGPDTLDTPLGNLLLSDEQTDPQLVQGLAQHGFHLCGKPSQSLGAENQQLSRLEL